MSLSSSTIHTTPIVLQKFLRYVKIDTQSKHDASTVPSTEKQFVLAHMLVKELEDLHLKDVSVDEHCYVMATLPSNCGPSSTVLGLLAHMDTSPDAPGEGVDPQIITNYTGGDIVLPKDTTQVIPAAQLEPYKGMDIVTSDGTTLLGADDKAGVAAIMALLERLQTDPTIRHGELRVCFTPDEEVGCGVDFLDVKKYGADVAYTIDGGEIGELEDENFNAFSAELKVKGVEVHPGYAYGILENASRAIGEFVGKLPLKEAPETTKEREGYIHPIEMGGNASEAYVRMIIRSFDMDEIERYHRLLQDIVESLKPAFPHSKFELAWKESYRNMKEELDKRPELVKYAHRAMEMAGIEVVRKPIRGGTDGARLSFMGIPTPNIFAGGVNFHSKREFVPVQVMEKCVDVLQNLMELFAQ